MSLSATSNKTFQTQALLEIVRTAKAQNKLGQGEELKLSGPTVSFEDLKKQCDGHPQLEALVQDYIDHPDKYQQGQSTVRHETPANTVSFGGQTSTPAAKPAAAKPTPEKPAALQALLERIRSRAAEQPIEVDDSVQPLTTLSFNIVPPGMEQITKLEEMFRALSASRANADNTPDENTRFDKQLGELRGQILALADSTEGTYRSNLVEGLKSYKSQQESQQQKLSQLEAELKQAKPEEAPGIKRNIEKVKQNLATIAETTSSHESTATKVLTRLQAVKLKYQTNLTTWGQNVQFDTKTTQFARNLATYAGSVAELYTKPQGSGVIQPEADLKLSQGSNFIYANLILCKDPATLGKVENLLKRQLAGTLSSVKPEEQKLLNDMGIHFKNGQLHNIMNRSELSSQAIGGLIATTKSLSVSGAEGPDGDGIAMMRSALAAAMSDSAAMNEARAGLNDAIAKLDEATGKHSEAQVKLDESRNRLNEGSQDLDAARQMADEVADVMQTGGPVGILNYLTGLDDAKLAQFNKLFAASQLRVERSPNNALTYFVDDKPAPDQQVFWQRFGQAAETIPALISQKEHEVKVYEDDVAARAEEVKATGEEVEQHQQGVKTARDGHARAVTQAEHSLQSATDLVREHAHTLGPDFKQAVETVLASAAQSSAKERKDMPSLNERIEQGFRRADASLAAGRKKIAAANEAISVSRPRRQRVRKMLMHWQSMLPKLGEQINKLMKLPARTPVQQLAEDTARKLIERADKLEGDFNRALAPVPNPEKLKEFTEKLRALVDETQSQFQSLHDSQQANAGVQKKISGDHFLKQLDQSAYHAKKLKALSGLKRNLTPAEIQELSAALKHVKGSLFVNQSVLAS